MRSSTGVHSAGWVVLDTGPPGAAARALESWRPARNAGPRSLGAIRRDDGSRRPYGNPL
ncbi:hypothetical protein CSC33_1788 [Pseudomonas aeruginosa]|nr:hypothetical protein CSC33_1788 [Pseudomonas aeruginosa]